VKFAGPPPPRTGRSADQMRQLSERRWSDAREAAKSPTKRCRTCSIEFPRDLSHFQSYKLNADRLLNVCRSCEAARMAARPRMPGSSERYREQMRLSPEESALLREYQALIRFDPCALCGVPGEVFDHIDPLARGGAHSWRNMARLCNRCNTQKQATSLLVFMLGRV
jgi:5-methylcytosine-specific restriction endonuclease McrA